MRLINSHCPGAGFADDCRGNRAAGEVSGRNIPVDRAAVSIYVFAGMTLPSHHKPFLRTVTRWALILALLLGQSLALAHHHDADQGTEGTCALCLHAQQSGDVVPATAAGITVQKFHTAIASPVLQGPAAVTILPFNSRAPLFSSC